MYTSEKEIGLFRYELEFVMVVILNCDYNCIIINKMIDKYKIYDCYDTKFF